MTVSPAPAVSPALARSGARIVAFVSKARKAGRTGAVVNLAWLLATTGKRVLIVDWCADGPRVEEFLEPFRAGDLGVDDAVKPPLGELLAPSADHVVRYRPVGPATVGELFLIAAADEDAAVPADTVGLREALRATDYDFIFLDTPHEIDDEALTRLAALCDAVVVCAPRRQPVTAIRTTVEHLRAGAVAGLRVVALPLVEAEEPRRGRARAELQRELGPLVSGPYVAAGGTRHEFAMVDVPDTYYSYDYQAVLPVLLDDPADGGTALAAFAEAAAWLAGVGTGTFEPVSAGVRRRYRASVGVDVATIDENVVVLYHPDDRPWAEWARDQLDEAGARAWLKVAPREPAGRQQQVATLVVHSGQPVGVRPAAGALPGESYVLVVAGDLPSDAQVIDVREAAADRARAELLRGFGLFPRTMSRAGGRGRSGGSRYPLGRNARLVGLPSRNALFVGRGAFLETVRDRLASPATPLTLTGGQGMGKSEAAKEYAYRYAYDYDLVCWVPAQDVGSIRSGLTALGRVLNVPETAGGTAEAAISALAKPDLRWLLIFDNAENMPMLREFLPAQGNGHVLITSREYGANGLPNPLEITELREGESAALLCGRIAELDLADARLVATAVDHLPLALRVAAAWIQQSARLLVGGGATPVDAVRRAVVEYLARLAALVEADAVPAPRDVSIAHTIDVSLASLDDPASLPAHWGTLARRVAEFVAFLSADGVSLRLLRSAPFLLQLAEAAELPPRPLLFDASDLDQVLLLGERFGLFDLTWGNDAALVMHRAVQQHVRERLRGGQRGVRHEQVLLGLARYAPTDPVADDGHLQYRFAELLPHLVASEAVTSGNSEVRHWIVKQVRYQYLLGDGATWRAAIEVAEAATAYWRDRPLLDRAMQSALHHRLDNQRANLERGLGHAAAAVRLDSQTLQAQEGELGRMHFRSLVTRRGLGGSLRLAGDFQGALESDTLTLTGFRLILGDLHPHTRMAVHNLSMSAYLAGDAKEALDNETGERDLRLELYGEDDPRVWRAAGWIGTFQRELGFYDLSVVTLRDAWRRMHAIRENHADTFAIQQNLSVTLRRLERHEDAKRESTGAFHGYRQRFGDDHPQTRAARLNMAVDYFLSGDLDSAVEMAEYCRRGLEATLTVGHPFTAICLLNLSLFRRALGEPEAALRLSRPALAVLEARLGTTHPWTLAARTNEAGHLAARGDLADAETRQAATTDACISRLGRGHPMTAKAQATLEAIRAAIRDGDPAVPPDRSAAIDIDIPQT